MIYNRIFYYYLFINHVLISNYLLLLSFDFIIDFKISFNNYHNRMLFIKKYVLMFITYKL